MKKIKIDSYQLDSQGRWVICDITTEMGTYSIINVYGCNTDNVTPFEEICNALENKPIENLIMGGDFNFVMDPAIDSKCRTDSHPKSREIIKRMTEILDLNDIWRTLNPDKTQFTW